MQNHFLAWVATAVIGMTGLGVAIKVYLPKILRFIRISRSALDLLDDIVQAAEDSKLTADEIQKIADQAKVLIEQLKPKEK